MLPAWLAGRPSDWRLALHVQPGASRTGLRGEHDGRLRLAVAAPPVDGAANDAIIKWFARQLRIPRSGLAISAGAASRRKVLTIRAPLDAATLLRRLALD